VSCSLFMKTSSKCLFCVKSFNLNVFFVSKMKFIRASSTSMLTRMFLSTWVVKSYIKMLADAIVILSWRIRPKPMLRSKSFLFSISYHCFVRSNIFQFWPHGSVLMICYGGILLTDTIIFSTELKQLHDHRTCLQGKNSTNNSREGGRSF